MEFRCIDIPVKIIPNPKHKVDSTDDNFTFFSTRLPKNAADIPKKKIARENAHSIVDFEQPNS